MEQFFQLAFISLALFLVVLNGFFVASEFSIVKIRETRIQELARRGSLRARTARVLVRGMDEFLSATQLGITLASLGLGWIGEPAFARLFEPLFQNLGGLSPILSHSFAAGSAFLLITFLHIVVGELAPKSLAIQRAEPVLLWIAIPLNWFYRLSYPMIWALNGSANFLIRLAAIPPSTKGERAHSGEELRLILTESHAEGILDQDAKKLLERVLDFTDRSVRQVMVPSVEVAFLDIRKSLKENLFIAQRHRHTRYPLCDGGLDLVLGIVHVKDLFWRQREVGSQLDLEEVKRPVQFVPEQKHVKSLLTEFRRTRTHFAVVVDEYGSTVGIVTLEDVLEELVGEIQDEFDSEVPEAMIQKMGDQHYIVHGRTLLEHLRAHLQIEIEDSENDTIAGHLMMTLGRTGRIGDEIVVAGRFRVRVVGMKGLQITDLLFARLPQQEPIRSDRSPPR